MSVTALPDSRAALPLVAPHIHRTPLLASRTLSEETGFDVRLKAELFQRTGSYKIRGPLVKLARLSQEERERGVVCSSAGNHAQGVALAAAMLGVRAVVCMAENATPSKIAATRGYGAEVVLHGSIWDEADEKARELVANDGLTYVHPFDDVDLISGQGTVGLEIYDDWPEVEVVVVPIGGGGLISGISAALKRERAGIRIVGVESADGPAMQRSVEAGELVTLRAVRHDHRRPARQARRSAHVRAGAALRGRNRDRSGRSHLRERALGDGALQARGRGRRGGHRRSRALGSRRGDAGD